MKITHPLAILTSAAIIIAASLGNPLASDARKPVKQKVFPTNGKVLKVTLGDLMCYVDLIDARGRKYNLGATFDACEGEPQSNEFRNKRVQLEYKPIKVNDCQSSEPCGKTRTENLIVNMKLIRK